MRVYLDTNILVAYFKPGDPYYSDSRTILEKTDIDKIVSFLTLTEFLSVIFRLYRNSQIEFTPKIREIFSQLPLKSRAVILLKYIVRKFNLNILGAKELLNFRINSENILFPLEFLKAINMAGETGLRTLDNLHLAIVALENKVSKIDYFITGDRDFINKRQIVFRVTGVPVLTPSEFAHLLGLKH
ncbi:MAG: type II toxin-antitoxin system VapC family toxin [Candidatus Njordarchaeales archaeon]